VLFVTALIRLTLIDQWLDRVDYWTLIGRWVDGFLGGGVTGGVANTVTSLIPWRLLRQNGPGTGQLLRAPAEALTARETAALHTDTESQIKLLLLNSQFCKSVTNSRNVKLKATFSFREFVTD